ncbi:MAG: FGGY-family carbohydrate kinase, partial [Planctomycetota bacterium]
IYRATLEGLCFQLRDALEILSRATGLTPRTLRVVGGGSRNALWNQIRADVTGLPVVVVRKTEATVLGAAIFAFAGTGVLASVPEAQKRMNPGEKLVKPSAGRTVYRSLYDVYRQVPPALRRVYRSL